MFKNILSAVILSTVFVIPVYAEDAVFSNTDSEQFNLQPLTYDTVPVVKSSETTQSAAQTAQTAGSEVSNKNFLNAINNLDNAQVEIREQMAATSALMAQAKTNYETQKEQYKAYKKQYKELKSKMRDVEKSKSLIQGNLNVNSQN